MSYEIARKYYVDIKFEFDMLIGWVVDARMIAEKRKYIIL